MIYKYGDMWSIYPSHTNYLLFTANSYIKNNGALVMGRGAAKQARDRLPGIDMELGRKVVHLGKYGIVLSNRYPRVGAFQVKYGYSEQANIWLIQESVFRLFEFLAHNPGLKIDLNFPGIGNGGLDVKTVEPIIKLLPDSVRVWRYSK